MKKVSRAATTIDKMVGNHTLTSDGRDWLTLSLDPFHDLEHAAAGYPDADSTHTVVSCYQGAYDLARPAVVPDGNAWDAHVFSLPMTAQNSTSLTFWSALNHPAGNYLRLDAAGPGTMQLDMINIITNASGLPLFPANKAERVAGQMTVTPIQPTNVHRSRATRVIGAAIEVVDTTADIYKQGALTCYRMPQFAASSTSILDSQVVGALWIGARDSGNSFRAPPASVAAALKLVGSRQWAAREGCYSLITQNNVANPLTNAAPYRADIKMGPVDAPECWVDYSQPIAANATPMPSMLSTEGKQFFPNNTTGIMMTGLNSNATFRIKYKIYVEVAPQPWDADLVVLATPSAAYDPTALEAYSKALTVLPVGVPACENGLGDWFAGLADVLSKVALPISAALTPVFGPGALAVGAGVGSVSAAVRSALAGQKKNDALYPDEKGRLSGPSTLKAAKPANKPKPKTAKRAAAGLARMRAKAR